MLLGAIRLVLARAELRAPATDSAVWIAPGLMRPAFDGARQVAEHRRRERRRRAAGETTRQVRNG